MKKHVAALSLLLILGLAACQKKQEAGYGKTEAGTQPQTAPATATKEAAEPEYKTGREAFQRMYASARMWGADARPFKLESADTSTAMSKEGKAAIWRAGFASASRRAIKTFMWSGLPKGEDTPDPGVSAGTEDSYNPSNASTRVFDIQFLKVDSDKAYEVAQKHGGEKLTKKDPKQEILYRLDWDPRENTLLWHVIYGSGPMDAKLKIAVNATNGQFLRVEK